MAGFVRIFLIESVFYSESQLTILPTFSCALGRCSIIQYGRKRRSVIKSFSEMLAYRALNINYCFVSNVRDGLVCNSSLCSDGNLVESIQLNALRILQLVSLISVLIKTCIWAGSDECEVLICLPSSRCRRPLSVQNKGSRHIPYRSFAHSYG